MKLINSFSAAMRGVLDCVRNEMNFRIHTVAAVTVIIFSWLYGVTAVQAAVLTLVICLVMVAEMINTAVEAMVDLISLQKSQFARIAKDSAAGAVLILAVGAVIIAVFTFSDTDKLKSVLDTMLSHIIWFVLYAVVCVYYIFSKKIFKKR